LALVYHGQYKGDEQANAHLIRYSRWDGTQQVFDQDEDDILAYGDVNKALRSLLERGLRDDEGEPTAHLEEGQAYFGYPPSYRTVDETLKEVKRCTQEGITINAFMLEANYYLMDFVDKMTRINRGRAFYSTPGQLGKYVMVDCLRSRRKRVGYD